MALNHVFVIPNSLIWYHSWNSSQLWKIQYNVNKIQNTQITKIHWVKGTEQKQNNNNPHRLTY